MSDTTVFIVRSGDTLKLLRLGMAGDDAEDRNGVQYACRLGSGCSPQWAVDGGGVWWDEVVGPTMLLKLEEPEVEEHIIVRLLFGGRPHRFQTLTLSDPGNATDQLGRPYARESMDHRTWINSRGMKWRRFPS